jgi:glycosyltransferase involved in cell wall biosynthesis
MVIAHLMASPFYGGPEKQMLGLARALPASHRSVFLSFPERGLCRPFLAQVRRHGFDAIELTYNYPQIRRAINEVTQTLRQHRADILTCSTYKPDLLGYLAARRLGIPVIAVCHGWTWANWKARINEALDRRILRYMDQAVCVSQAQADKVLKAGVARDKIKVIRNAVDEEAFGEPRPEYRERLRSLFANPPRFIIGAAGRLSPEKGFDQLVEAAAIVRRERSDLGFVVFGEGPMHQRLQKQIAKLGLAETVVLAGFRTDVAQFLPHLDLVVLPSFTEGLPVVLLEAFAAGVAVVGTTVGGIPEVIENGRSGWLVPPGDPTSLAERIVAMFQDDEPRRAKGQVGRERVRRDFTFPRMAEEYRQLFDQLRGQHASCAALSRPQSVPTAVAECIR